MTVSSQPLSELKTLIPPDHVLIEYYYRDREMYAFVLNQNGLRAFRLDSSERAEDVQKYRTLLENTHMDGHAEMGKKLYSASSSPSKAASTDPSSLSFPTERFTTFP